MRIVADENIPFAREAFSHLGEVALLPGKAIRGDELRGVRCLLVRSVTRVDETLLRDASVEFVGAATIGTDHVDLAYLEERRIAFASAPGSNADSVAEYVVAGLLYYAADRDIRLEGKSIGIVGVGNVGSRVRKMAETLGMRPVPNDPPLEEETGDETLRSLGEALEADFVTLHVPLTREGPHPTFHLADRSFLDRVKPGAVFINTSRGAAADTVALREALNSGNISAAIVDVWENEPNIDLVLLERSYLATSHIAGYSLDGKAHGVRMIYRAACEHFGAAPQWDFRDSLSSPTPNRIGRVDAAASSPEAILHAIVRQAYDIGDDDTRLRGILEIDGAHRADYYTNLRKNYPIRREFHNFEVRSENLTEEIRNQVAGLGFRLAEG